MTKCGRCQTHPALRLYPLVHPLCSWCVSKLWYVHFKDQLDAANATYAEEYRLRRDDE